MTGKIAYACLTAAALLTACGSAIEGGGEGTPGADAGTLGSDAGTPGNDAGMPGSDAGISCSAMPVNIVHDSGYVAQHLSQRSIDNAVYPDAVCNDGTAPLYVVRPGYGGGARRWLISLEGGGSCYDQPSCQARRDTMDDTGYILTTSNAGIQAVGDHGILASDPSANPDFYDANEVRVHYCSSDSWQGTYAAKGAFVDSDPSTWSFQGHAIVKAVIEDLLATGGLADANEVILEGESGGGAGVFFNANAVAALLPAGARFVAIADAAFVVDVPGYDATADGGVSTAPPPYPNDLREAESLALWQGTGDSICSQAQGAGDVSCSFPEALLDSHAYPMPVLVRQSEEDEQKFPALNAPDPTTTPANAEPAQAYFAWYVQQQRAALGALPPPYSAFAPDITDHIDLLGGDANGPFTFDVPIFNFPDGESLSTEQAVHLWYADPCTQHLWIQ